MKKENLGKYLRYSVTDVKSYRQWKWVSLRKRRPVYLYLYQFHLIFGYAVVYMGLIEDATDAASSFIEYPLIFIAAHAIVFATCFLPNKYKSFLHDYRGERLCELTIMSSVLCSCALLLPVTVPISENGAMANAVTLAFTTCMSLLYFHHLGLSVSTIFVTKIIFFMLWMIFMRVVQHNIFLIIVSLSSFFSFYSFGSLLEYELFIEYRKHEDYHRDQLQIHMRNVFAEDNLLLLKRVDKQLDTHLTYLQRQLLSVITTSNSFLIENKNTGNGLTSGSSKENMDSSNTNTVGMTNKEKLQMKEELFHVLTTTAAKLLETRYLRHALYYALLTNEDSKFDRYMKFPFKKTCRRLFSMIETSVGHGLPYFVDANSSEILITAPKVIFEIIIFLLLYTTKYSGICYLTCENKSDNWEIRLQMTISNLQITDQTNEEEEEAVQEEEEEYEDEEGADAGGAGVEGGNRRGEKSGGHDILNGGEEELDDYNRLVSPTTAQRRLKPQPRKHQHPSSSAANPTSSNGGDGRNGTTAFTNPFSGGKKQIEKTATDIIFATLKQEQQDCEDYGLVTTKEGVTEFTDKKTLRETTLERFSERITKHYLKTKIHTFFEPHEHLKIITKKIPLSLEECTIEQTHHHNTVPPANNTAAAAPAPTVAPPVSVTGIAMPVNTDGGNHSTIVDGNSSGGVAMDSLGASSTSLTAPITSGLNSGAVSTLVGGQQNIPTGVPSTAANIPFFQDEMMIENDYAMKQQMLIIIPRTQETQRIIEFKEKLQVLSIPNVVKSMSILHDYPYQHFIGVVLDTHLPKMTDQEVTSLSKIVTSFIMISMNEIRDPTQMSQQYRLNIIACIRSKDSIGEIMETVKEACKKTSIQYSFLEEFENLDELQSTLQQLKVSIPGQGSGNANAYKVAGKGNTAMDPGFSSGSSAKSTKRGGRDNSGGNLTGSPPPTVCANSTSSLSASPKAQLHHLVHMQQYRELLDEFWKLVLKKCFPGDKAKASIGGYDEKSIAAIVQKQLSALEASESTFESTSENMSNFSFQHMSDVFKTQNKQYEISKSWQHNPQKMKMYLLVSYFMIYINVLREQCQKQNYLFAVKLLGIMGEIAASWKLGRWSTWVAILKESLEVIMTIMTPPPKQLDSGDGIAASIPHAETLMSSTQFPIMGDEKAAEEYIRLLASHPVIGSYSLPLLQQQNEYSELLREMVNSLEVGLWDTAMER